MYPLDMMTNTASQKHKKMKTKLNILVQTSVELCTLFSVFEYNGNSLSAESGSIVGVKSPGAVKNWCSVISVKRGRDSGLF